jgi:glycosyltransferase involved in cell wall biosynthesis
MRMRAAVHAGCRRANAERLVCVDLSQAAATAPSCTGPAPAEMVERMRIASLVPESTIESIYRSIVPMQALAHRGHSVHIEERNVVQNPATLLDYDAVHVMRLSHPVLVRLTRHLQQRGIAVVWDNDDERIALLREAVKVPGQDSMTAQHFFSALRTISKNADVVTTPSEGLARLHAEDSGREVRIVPNYLPPTFRRPQRVMPHEGVHIGWMAMPHHQPSFEALDIRAALQGLLARHGHLTITGVGLDLGLNSRRYTHVPGIPYGSLAGSLAHFDVAIAPLAESAVNRARSDVKLKEYAAAGVAWLASPIGPYAGFGEQQGGRLVPDDGWVEAIEALMNDADARRVLAQRGMRWAAGETIEAHVDIWEGIFEDAIAHARAPQGVR